VAVAVGGVVVERWLTIFLEIGVGGAVVLA
jgi:hypothetical protein